MPYQTQSGEWREERFRELDALIAAEAPARSGKRRQAAGRRAMRIERRARRRVQATECSVKGCKRHVEARGMCGRHYHRWCRYGDPLAGGTFQGDAEAKTCTRLGCTRKFYAKGLCQIHYLQQWQRENHGAAKVASLGVSSDWMRGKRRA
jgi:hypothetical protein